MPGFVGPFAGFALGVALALQSRRALERFDERERQAARRIAALLGLLVFAPVCAYFLVFAGDWSVAYQVDTRSVPSALVLALVAVDALAVPLGFAAADRAIRERARRGLFLLGFVPALLGLGLALAFAPELGLEGTTFQVRNRFGTRALGGSPLGFAVLWMDALVLAGFAIAVRSLTSPPLRPASIEDPTIELPPPPPDPKPPPARDRPPRLLGRGR